MITIRKSNERGYADHGWLKSYHTFSFAGYRDPNFMGFRNLRVINEDRVAPEKGFGTHAHENMEIVSYVLEGKLEHKDSMGNGAVLTPGEFQRISAGTGIEHSEFNPSHEEPVHFYQIWLYPSERDVTPSYEQKRFDPENQNGAMVLVASPDGAQGSFAIRTDARIFLGRLSKTKKVTHQIVPKRHGWLQVLRGSVDVNGMSLSVGDAIATSDEKSLEIEALNEAEVMFFDLG